jgi:hypothetical protein
MALCQPPLRLLSSAWVPVRRNLRFGVGGSEPLARSLLSKRHFAKSTGRVKPAGLRPAPNGAASTFRVAGLAEKAIWSLAERKVGKPQGKAVLARAQFSATQVRTAGLRLDADDEPPRHVNVIG